jgi:hypothetical protein
MKEQDLIENKELRERCISRIEVLDKVGSLLLLPNTEYATVEQVAKYYEVTHQAIETIISRHRDELETDGFKTFRKNNVIQLLNIQDECLENVVGKAIATLKNGSKIEIPNRGLRLFPRRAILRVGMLLQDSEVAKEVRTYLLNAEEELADEQKEKIKDEQVEKEKDLIWNIMSAKDEIEQIIAIGNLKKFKDEKIKKQDIIIQNQQSKIDALVDGILRWDARAGINKMMRLIANNVFQSHGKYAYAMAWDKLRAEMLYKHNIHVTKRIQNSQKKNATIFDVLNREELRLAVKTALALCSKYDIDTSEILVKEDNDIA